MILEINREMTLQAHMLISQFLNDINSEKKNDLEHEFEINDELYDEIIEILEISFEAPYSFSVIDVDEIYSIESRSIFEIFKMNNPEELGIECAIFNNNKITDMTLEGRFSIREGKLFFMYINFRF